MLGQKYFEIFGRKEQMAGISTSDELDDAGLSPSSSPYNPVVTPGVIYLPASQTDKSTGLTGEMIASCEDASGTYARVYVSSTTTGAQAGRYWTATSDGTLTQRGSADTSNTFASGKTDMICFQREIYVTTAATIERWELPATFNGGGDYPFSFSDSTAPHPALVYNGFAYYGDGDLLLRQTAAGVAPTTILQLENTNDIIVALGVDPGSGSMLISYVSQINVSGTENSNAKVGYYDGASQKLDKVVPVDAMVTAFPYTEGQLYAAYETKLGLWNGAGITFLRNFDFQFDNYYLPYKHHFTSIGSTLYMIENTRVIAHGPLQQGGAKVFYPAFANALSSQKITNIAYLHASTSAGVSSQLISLSYATSQFLTFNTRNVTTVSAATGTIYDNRKYFERPIWIRRFKVFFKNPLSNGNEFGDLKFLNEETDTVMTYTLKNNFGSNSYVAVVDNVDIKLYTLQVYIAISGNFQSGIRRVLCYYDPADL